MASNPKSPRERGFSLAIQKMTEVAEKTGTFNIPQLELGDKNDLELGSTGRGIQPPNDSTPKS